MNTTTTTGARRMLAAGVAAAALATLSGCGSDNGAASAAQTGDASCASGSLAGGGSTFQLNIQQQWTADFAKACAGAQVNYNGVGSGAGIQQFGAGTLDFAGSDVPMLPDEQQAADKRCDGTAITFPVIAGGVAIIYRVDGVKRLNLSASTLAGIFQGTIKRWNDPAIATDNPGAKLPSTPVVTYHRADGSGTTAVFSAFEKANAPRWTLGSDKELNWPGGQGATGSDGVVQGVKQTNGGITYAEISYAQANGLATANVAAAAGKFVAPTAANISHAVDTGFVTGGSKGSVIASVDYHRLVGYPLSTVSYAITCQHYASGDLGSRVRAYLTYALAAGQAAADSLGYAQLPTGLDARATTAVDSVS